MERTQIYITEAQKKSLALLAAKTGESQSVLIRRAIDDFLASERSEKVMAQKDFWTKYAGTLDAVD
jgi:predicted transcriptional regulator